MINKEEVLRFSAGRDLDIIIAERLMGWQIETDQTKIKRLSQYLMSDSQGRWWRTRKAAGTLIHRPTHQTLLLLSDWSK